MFYTLYISDLILYLFNWFGWFWEVLEVKDDYLLWDASDALLKLQYHTELTRINQNNSTKHLTVASVYPFLLLKLMCFDIQAFITAPWEWYLFFFWWNMILHMKPVIATISPRHTWVWSLWWCCKSKVKVTNSAVCKTKGHWYLVWVTKCTMWMWCK